MMAVDRYGDLLPRGAVDRLGNVRLQDVRDMVFLSDGTLLMAGRSLRWMEVGTAKERRAEREHEAAIACLALSSDGRVIASGSDDTTIVLWDVTGRKLAHLRKRSKDGVKSDDLAETPPMAVSGLAFLSDGRKLASAHRNGTLTIWDVKTATRLKSFRLYGKLIRKMAVSSSQNMGCAYIDDGSLLAFDMDTAEEIWSCRAHEGHLGDVEVSPEGSCFVSAGTDGTVCFWEANTGRLLQKHQCLMEGLSGIGGLAYSPDGSLLAAGGVYGPIEILATKSVEMVCSIPVVGELGCLVFSPDSKTLAATISSGMWLWDVTTGKEHIHVAGPSFIQDMCLSPDGRWVALGESQSVGIWELGTGNQIQRLGTPCGIVVVSPDGRTLASAGIEDPVRVWDVESRKAIWSLDSQRWVRALAFSPDGQFLASGDCDPDHGSRIMVWNVRTGKLECVKRGDPRPSLETLSAVWESVRATIEVEDTRGLAVRIASKHVWDASCLAFSPDGSLLASAGLETVEPAPGFLIRLWSFPQLTGWRGLKGHRGYIETLSFGRDGRMLASGSHDGSVLVWDVFAGRVHFALEGHTDTVNTVAFSGDGRLLASGSQDRTICVWDLSTGQRVCKLAGHLDAVRRVAFQPDGESLLSASSDSTILTWDVMSFVP
jgi:WD40 repeat protein